MHKSTKKLNIAIKYNIPLDLSLPKTLKDAVIKRDYFAVKHLLKNGANPNEQDADGKTPLHFATKDNRLFIANLLMQHGACPMRKDKEGHNCFDYALIYKSNSLINLFEKKFSGVNIRNYYSFFTLNQSFVTPEDKNNKINTTELNLGG